MAWLNGPNGISVDVVLLVGANKRTLCRRPGPKSSGAWRERARGAIK